MMNTRCAVHGLYLRPETHDPGCPWCPRNEPVVVLPGQRSLFEQPIEAMPHKVFVRRAPGVTRVVNIRTDGCTIYIGRAKSGKSPRLCDPGIEEGWAGNPHPVSKCGPLALPFFRRYLRERLDRDLVFRAAVEKLHGHVLGCFCKPASCHGDVYVEWLETGKIEIDPREELEDT